MSVISDKLEIEFDTTSVPHGQPVHGHVVVKLTKDTKGKDLALTMMVKEWSNIEYKDENGDLKRAKESKILFTKNVACEGFTDDMPLKEGKHSFAFNYVFPTRLPASMRCEMKRGSECGIDYTVQATMSIIGNPMSTEKKFKMGSEPAGRSEMNPGLILPASVSKFGSCIPMTPVRTAALGIKLEKTHMLGMTDQVDINIACIDESPKPIRKLRLSMKQYIFFHAHGHEEMFKKNVTSMTVDVNLINKNRKVKTTSISDPYLTALHDELNSEDVQTLHMKCGDINDMWSYDGELVTVKYFFTSRLVVDGKRDPHVHCEMHIGNGKLSPLPPNGVAQQTLRTPIGAGIDNSEYIHEVDFPKDSLPWLIHETPYNRVAQVKEMCKDDKWKKIIGALTPQEYAEAVTASYGETDQVAIAKILASAIKAPGMTSEHAALAVRASLYYKKEIAREIGPMCIDVKYNGIFISAQMNTWENICVQDALFPKPKEGEDGWATSK